MDSTIDNCGFTDLSLEDEDLILVSGAPRTGKTTNTLKACSNFLNEDFSASKFVFMARTKATVKSTYNTFREYVDMPQDLALQPCIMYLGVGEMCPSLEGGHEFLPDYLLHRQRCNKRKDVDDKDEMKKVLSIIEDKGPDFDNQTCEKLYKAGYCPRAVVELYLSCLEREDNYSNHNIFTTYSSSRILLKRHPRLFKERNVILDEYRHFIDFCTKEQQIELNEKPSELSYAEIWAGYKGEMRKYDFNNLFEEEFSEELSAKMEALIDYLEGEFEGWQEERKDGGENALHREELDIGISEGLIGNIEEKILSTQSEGLMEVRELFEAGRKIEEEGCIADFDFVSDSTDKKTLQLIIRKREDGYESRELLNGVIEAASDTFLLDSTPYPDNLSTFTFGSEEYQVERTTVETDYEHKVLVEDAKNSRTDTWKDLDNAKRMAEKIRQTQEMFERHGMETIVFARAKAEKEKLEKRGVENVTYARGVDSEGTSADADIVISMGPPFQNITSEEYRKYDLARMTGTSDPENAISTLRKVKAYQEMFQHAFRTARANASATVLMNTEYRVLKEAKNWWPWLQNEQIEIKRMKTKNYTVSDKVSEIKAYTVEGKEDYTYETERRIRKDIKNLLEEENSLQKEEIVNTVTGDTKTKRKVLDGMIDEGIVEVDKGRYNRHILSLN
ncbi:MAG: hypothetical protein ABEJ83_05795 [Candidatus Nanohaloarchaea archaeon]